MSMQIKILQVNPFVENCIVVWDEASLEAVVADPGMMTQAEEQMVLNFINVTGLHVSHILLTHCHLDHAAGARWLATHTGADVCGSPLDAQLAQSLGQQAAMFGLDLDLAPLSLDVQLQPGDTIAFAGQQIKVLPTPGHTPGGLTYYFEQSGMALVGDSIFMGSIGRTDLPGGNMSQLIASIKRQILNLPPDTTLISGHGPATTVAQELQYNPYV